MPKIVLQNPPSGVPEVEVAEEAKMGGEGAVYFSTDGRFAVKVYHQPHPDKEKLLQYVMKLFSTLPPEQERFLLRPLALVETLDGHKRVGFIMRRVPPEYRELMAYVLNARYAAEQFQYEGLAVSEAKPSADSVCPSDRAS